LYGLGVDVVVLSILEGLLPDVEVGDLLVDDANGLSVDGLCSGFDRNDMFICNLLLSATRLVRYKVE
jgi:hypothetical protein